MIDTEKVKILSYRLAQVTKTKTQAEAEEKKLKAELLDIMQTNKRKELKTDYMTINYKGESTRYMLDKAKVEKKYPDIYEECIKESTVKPYLVVRLKKSALSI